MVSVIIPIYKVEKYLRECIESIIVENEVDLEIILVDDGSPDNCPIICDEYAQKDKRIKVIHKQNGGVVSAWKAGLNACLGEYVVFIDGDDVIEKKYLKKIYDICVQNNVDFVSCGCKRLYPDQKEYSFKINTLEEGKYEVDDKILSKIICDNGSYKKLVANAKWSKIIKASIAKEAMVWCSEKISYGDDIQFVIAVILLSKNFYISNYEGYLYRFNEGSIVNTYKKDLWNQIELLVLVLQNINNKFNIPNFEKQLNTLIVLYADDIIQKEMFHKTLNYKENIKQLLKKKILRDAFKNYNTNKMGNYDKLMSKAVKIKSMILIKMVYFIYSLYLNI